MIFLQYHIVRMAYYDVLRNGNVELPEICLLKMCWGGVFRCLRLCGASLDTSSSLPYMSFFTNLMYVSMK